MSNSHFLPRVASAFLFLAFSSLLGSDLKPPRNDAEYEGGTIIEFNGYPVIGRGNELWSFENGIQPESDGCWKKIDNLERYSYSAKIHVLLPIEDILEIGTLKDGLFYYDGKQIVKETGYNSIYVINALAQIEQGQILVGTLGDTPVLEKESGLWAWTRSTNTWDVDPNNLPPHPDVTALLVDTTSPEKTVYAGTRSFGIYQRGSGWWKKMTGTNLGSGVIATLHSDIQQIAVSFFGDHILYAVAATNEASLESFQGFFRMENPNREDAVWERPQTGGNPYGYNVWSVAADPGDDRGVWIGTEKGLFYSSNAGNEWKQIEINPEPAKIQAILPFTGKDKGWLIILTSDGVVMTAPLAKNGGLGTNPPQWIKYFEDEKGENLCPLLPAPLTPTVNPVPFGTDTPTAAGSPPIAASRTPSITPTSSPTPTPDGDGRNFVLGILLVMIILAAISGIWIYTRRSRRKTILFLPAEPADAEPLPKIFILFLSAEPTNADHLRVEDEKEKIIEVLEKSTLRARYELKDRQAVGPEKFTQSLLQIKPKIVHFAGHGTESGEICLEAKSGKALPVSPEDLANLFKQFAGKVDCVILNTCYAAKQAAAIAKHIDFVIGVKKEFDNEAAIAFSTGFYQKLGEEYDIEKAFDFGCVQMGLEKIGKDLKPILKKKKT